MVAEAPTVWVGATISELTAPHPYNPQFFIAGCFLSQPSQFVLAWDRHRIMLDCIPGGLVHTWWLGCIPGGLVAYDKSYIFCESGPWLKGAAAAGCLRFSWKIAVQLCVCAFADR